MKSVGPQPPKMDRPCFACKDGLNGRKYCPTCGNTVDLTGMKFFGDPKERTSKEITQALSGFAGLKAGVRYRVVIEISKTRTEIVTQVIEGVCEWSQGPFAHIGGYNINTTEIKEVSIL